MGDYRPGTEAGQEDQRLLQSSRKRRCGLGEGYTSGVSETSPCLGSVLKIELMELADGLDGVGGKEKNH